MSEYIKPNLCKCGAKPKFERLCGWWHIECPKCHNAPHEKTGCTEVWGYNTRREAAEAWNKHLEGTLNEV